MNGADDRCWRKGCWQATILGIGVALAWVACDSGPHTEAAPRPAANVVEVADDLPTRAQPGLRTLQLYLGAAEIKAELALTVDQIRTGMMFRTNVGPSEGMLFVFGGPHEAGFWMKNVSIPLSCAYIDPEGVVLELHDMVPGEETPIRAATDRVQYVLETGRGWFQSNGISTGMLVRTELGSLRETFFGGRRPR